MNKNLGVFTSNSMEYETPQALFDELDKEFNFTLDVCASRENAKCGKFFTKEDNGLKRNWQGHVCWMNPPYGRDVGIWMEKACRENQEGVTVVCLIFARTDTKWFHKWVYGKAELRFIKGRLRFNNMSSSAPFPSMLVIYR